VVHVGDAAFVDQVDDELELVQALEVSHFGRVAGFDQSVETCLDELDRTTAQNGLLAEQVSFGFFAEGGLDDAGTAAADGAGVRQADVTSGTRIVLMHGHECRHAATLVVGAANSVTRRLGNDHDHIDVFARLNLTIVHVEAVSEGQRSAGLDVGCNVVTVHLSDVLIGQENHDQVGTLDRLGNFLNLQAGVFGLGPRCAALAQADHHVHAGIVQVECVGMALRAVTDDGDRLALDEGQIAVLVVVNLHGVLQKFNGFSLKFQYTFATPDARDACAHGLKDGTAIERVDEGLDLFLIAGQLHGVDLVGDVDDVATEDVGHALHFFALLADRPHLDEHELTLDVRPFGEVDHLDHVDQAIQVLGDLLDDVIGTRGDDGHARQRVVFGRRNGKSFDVVATSRKQAHDARERTGFVFQKDRNHVFHQFFSLQVFRTQQHFGQPPARLHHGPDVLGLVGNEVEEHQTVFVFAEGFTQGRLDIGRILGAPPDMDVTRDQLHEVRQRINVRFGIARAVFNLLPLTHHAQVTVVQAQNLGREAVLLAGGEFLDVHLNRTLALDHGD